MAKYFNISHGLRGCYMPDGDPYYVMVRTRRELKGLIAEHAESLGDMIGLSKKNIATFAATCWYEAHKEKPDYLPHCLPCHDRSVKISKYSYGIFVSVATRREYLDFEKERDSE